jgi:hypothetical protein
MRKILLLLCLSWTFQSVGTAQPTAVPEPQISFAKEDRPLSYYVAQAGLWWEVLQKDLQNEDSWYNYYRANRNAQGKANWSSDFVKEGPHLRLGDDIVKLMGEHIPESFTYNFVRGSTAAVYPGEGAYLIKAYQMNPDFPGLLATVATYATSTHNPELRKEANQRWFEKREFPIALMNYGYNTLQSVGENGILLTQHDNDTYPVWMLQDAKGIRTDVLVINIDFLLFDGYRERVFEQLDIPAFILEEVDINEYETNWANVVQHFLGSYQGDRPVHIGLSVSQQWYQPFADQLKVEGLTRTFQPQPGKNKAFFREHFILDYLRADLEFTTLLPRIRDINKGYLLFFDAVYAQLSADEQRFVREIARGIITHIENADRKSYFESRFSD